MQIKSGASSVWLDAPDFIWDVGYQSLHLAEMNWRFMRPML